MLVCVVKCLCGSPSNTLRPGLSFKIKTIFLGMGISIIKIRQSWDCLTLNGNSSYTGKVAPLYWNAKWTKWLPFCIWHFQMHFIGRHFVYFESNFTELCSEESCWQKVSIGSGDGLVPNRHQAITWTNDDPVHGCKYVPPGLNVLIWVLTSATNSHTVLSSEKKQHDMLCFCN